MHESLTAAREAAHSFSIAHAMGFELYLRGLRGEPEGARELAENLIAFSEEQGFAYWLAAGLFWQGWARAPESRTDDDLAQMREGLARLQATGAKIARSLYLASLAESYARAQRIEEGLHTVDEALAHLERHDERPHEAELHRLKGELLLRQETPEEEQAGACFHAAVEIARHQRAKLLELRATMSLARRWREHGKRDQARQMLADVYDWFTEGFETKDLKEAGALLAELA